ncbi:MAG: VWA domain-containing protein [Bacteroides sp.]|nr:VWA domain-containing protein [Bacteroides sp.]
MKKLFILLFVALQCFNISARQEYELSSTIPGKQIKGGKINKSRPIITATETEDTWESIGIGEWTDGNLIYSSTGLPCVDNAVIEKSKTRQNVYRIWPFSSEDLYVDYVIIHCESSNHVYFESFSYILNNEKTTFLQATEENQSTINDKYHYGTIDEGIIRIPVTSFIIYYDDDKSNLYLSKDDTKEYMIKMPAGFEYTESASGVYMGLTSFNDYITTKPISLLNETSCDEFTSFVNNMEMGTFTNLYKAVDISIDNLKSHTYPADLSNVILITFTDGLDMGSLDDSPFLKNKEYADYLAKKIEETKIRGISLQAYSIGLMSGDVFDEEQFMYNLNSIASQKKSGEQAESNIDFVCTVNDTQGLENQLTKIYENVNRQITKREVTIAVPMMEHESIVRFTLDGVAQNGKRVKDSQVWFEGTFNRLDMTLDNVIYTGFTSTSGQTFKIEKSKIKDKGYDVVLHDCHDINGNLLEVGHDNIDQYIYIPSRDDYQHNRENAKGNDIKIEDLKSSVAIMLALDASKSLEESDQGNLFPLVKSSACSFINLLAGKSNPSGIDSINYSDMTPFERSDSDIEFYNLQGIRINKPSQGIYICRKGNKVYKTILK